MRTHLQYLKKLESVKLSSETSIIIYDDVLPRVVPGFRRWIARYPFAFPVAAGEKLKSLSAFEKIAERIQRRAGENVTRSWTVVAIGGGSVGDFAGFFASVYRRGLRLVHIPTTWLAAIDSSHGGKTALNLGGAKNQIGSFYPASETILIRSLLLATPKESCEDAIGELAKIAMIDGRAWTRRLRRPPLNLQSRTRIAAWLWRCLPLAIDSKLRIVRRDPFEQTGLRQVLNLGHTFGHVIEADLKISHGRSVGLGLLFAIDASENLGALTSARAGELRNWLRQMGVARDLAGRDRVVRKHALRLLRADKKRDGGDFVWFLVIRAFGRIDRRRVEISQLLEIADVNGWLRRGVR